MANFHQYFDTTLKHFLLIIQESITICVPKKYITITHLN